MKKQYDPEMETMMQTVDGKLVTLTEEDQVAQSVYPEQIQTVRQTLREMFPAALPVGAQEAVEEIKATFNNKTGHEPSACVELAQQFTVAYGQHFVVRAHELLGRELRHEGEEILGPEWLNLVSDFDKYLLDPSAQGYCPLVRPITEAEANYAKAIFNFNLADLYRLAKKPEAGIQAIGKSLEEFSAYIRRTYGTSDVLLIQEDRIMAIGRLMMRAGFLNMMGRKSEADEALSEAYLIDSEVFEQMMQQKNPETYPELY